MKLSEYIIKSYLKRVSRIKHTKGGGAAVLDTEGTEIGLVDCIVGIQRYMVTVHGRADHAGTTPMDMRMDPVDAASKVISRIADWAREKADGTVATVGYVNTIPMRLRQ